MKYLLSLLPINTDRYRYLGTFEVIFDLNSVFIVKKILWDMQNVFHGIFLQIHKVCRNIYSYKSIIFVSGKRMYIAFEIDFFITSLKYRFRYINLPNC